MKFNLFATKFSLIIGILLYIAWGGANEAVAEEVYFYFSDDGTNSTIYAYGSLDMEDYWFDRVIDRIPYYGSYGRHNSGDDEFDDVELYLDRGTRMQIADRSPRSNLINKHGGLAYEYVQTSVANLNTYTGHRQINFSSSDNYRSDFLFFIGYHNSHSTLINDLPISLRANRSGHRYNYTGRKATFDGTLLSKLNDNDFEFTVTFNKKPDGNNSSYPTQQATFSTTDPFVDVKPVGLTATPGVDSQTGLGDGTITLSWTQLTGFKTQVVTGYEYKQQKDSGTYGDWTAMTNSRGNTSSYKVENLENGSTYKFIVRAMSNERASAESEHSDEVSAQLDAAPTFSGASAGPFEWLEDDQLSATISLPTATGGNGVLSYAITPSAPSGITFAETTLNDGTKQMQISGTPNAAQTATSYTLTVTDADSNTDPGDTDTLTFTITVIAQVPPVLPSETYDDQSYIKNSPIETFTLPTATSGNGALSYAITPSAPSGLTFSEITLGDGTKQMQISGTPDTVQAATEYTLTVSDSDGKVSADDTDSLTFNITVADDTGPSFGSQTIEAQTYDRGETITALQLPTATGGNGALRYSLKNTPALPAGLSFNPATRQITGTVTGNAQPATTYTYEVVDTDDTATTGDEHDVDKAELTFTIAVIIQVAPVLPSQTYDDQTYIENSPIETFTLPTATSGNGALSYAITPSAPSGLTFTEITLGDGTKQMQVSGTPDTVQAATEYTLTVSDSDSKEDASDTDSLTFNITVVDDTGPSFGSQMIDAQLYEQGETITALQLPAASGGNGALRYSLNATPALPTGLSFNSATRQITGTVTGNAQPATTYTYEAVDTDDTVTTADEHNVDKAELTFTIEVIIQVAPVLPSETYEDQSYIKNSPIETFTLPTATSGNGALSYAITPSAPSGLTFTEITLGDGTKQMQVSGTPDTVQVATEYTLTVSDSDSKEDASDTDSLTFNITVADDTGPSFGSQTIDAQTYDQGETITALQLPAATGGDGALRYSLKSTPALPTGLSFNPATRQITGTVTGNAQPATTYTYEAVDTDDTATTGDEHNVDKAELTFTIAVIIQVAPVFPSQTYDDQTYIENSPIETFTLPTATSGNGALSYAITPSAPSGLTFTEITLGDGTKQMQVSGTPDTVQAATEYTLTVSDSDSKEDASDTDSLTFNITVVDDTGPSFGSQTIDTQTYDQGETITALQLPSATGGNGALRYSLKNTPALPAGLSFNSATRQITGTVTGNAQPATTYTYEVVDTDDTATTGDEHDVDKAELTFTIAVIIQVAPVLPSQTYDDQTYIENSPIETISLPIATSGNGALSYAITPRAPSGLTFTEITRNDGMKQMQISGRPTSVQAATEYTLTVSDSDSKVSADDTDSLTFNITVVDDTGPSFGSQNIEAQLYEQEETITALQLPPATGGNGALRYSLDATPALPAGLSFNPATRRITGKVTGNTQRATTYTYRATDTDDTATTDDEHRVDTVELTFTIAIREIDTKPSFSQTVVNQSYIVGQEIDKLVLPMSALGNLPLTYTISPNPPMAGLTFAVGSGEITITGTPTANPGTTASVTYKVSDSDSDEAELTFTIEAVADLRPTFVDTTDHEISIRRSRESSEQLPVASGGNGALRYSIVPALPTGLNLSESTGRISGTIVATEPLGEKTYTYKVEDTDKNNTDADASTITVRITVIDPPPVDVSLIERSMQQTLSETAGIIGGVTMSSIRSRVQNYDPPQVSSRSGLNLRRDRSWPAYFGQDPVRMDADEFVRSGSLLSLVNAYTGSGLAGHNYLFWSDVAQNRFDGDDSSLRYDGEVSGISLGLDTSVGDGVLGGVALTRFTGKTDYTQSDGNTGAQKIKATSVNPYFGLRTEEYTMWTFVGIGSGDFRLEQDALTETSDLSLSALGIGGSKQVWSNAKTKVHLTGDLTLTELSVDASSGFIPEQDSSISRTRLLIEASQHHETSQGGVVTPSVELGVASDRGDGKTGSRVELGAGMNYRSAKHRVSLSLSSYGLLKRNNSSEWGVQGGIHMQPKESGGGMSFSLKPSYGAAVRGVDRIWDIGSTDDVAGDESYRPRLDADLSYGFRIIGDRGLLTPYSEVSLEGEDRTYRVGTRFLYGSKFELNLVGESAESANDEPESSIHFQGGIRF